MDAISFKSLCSFVNFKKSNSHALYWIYIYVFAKIEDDPENNFEDKSIFATAGPDRKNIFDDNINFLGHSEG